MAVYTPVTTADAQRLLDLTHLGQLQRFEGITAGIENSNYFLDSSAGSFVLTVFERLSFDELPYYLDLMRHLAQKDLPVPLPQACQVADSHTPIGSLVLHVNGKPAAIVNKLAGASHLDPSPAHCQAIGQTVARMHLAGADFPQVQANLRGLAWWNATVPVVLPYVSTDIAARLQHELAVQNRLADDARYALLPRGPVHGDLFRDNALFVGDYLSGVFDFYFAGHDTWLYDIAVCLNDWCVYHPEGTAHDALHRAFLAGYQSVRALTAVEIELLPLLLRAAALRFWISRLWDFYLPRAAVQLQAHDPAKFERVLKARMGEI